MNLNMKKIILIIVCLFLSGCATAPMRTPNVKNLSVMLPEQIMIEGVTIQKGQSFTDCVPVVLEAIFKFYGKSINRKEIDDKIHKGWGTNMKDVIEYVKENDFDYCFFYDRTNDKRGIKFFLAQNLPILVVGSHGVGWQGHIVILVGYDDSKKIFYVADPEWRAIQEQRYLDFNEWHKRRDSYGYVIYPVSKSIEKLDLQERR